MVVTTSSINNSLSSSKRKNSVYRLSMEEVRPRASNSKQINSKITINKSRRNSSALRITIVEVKLLSLNRLHSQLSRKKKAGAIKTSWKVANLSKQLRPQILTNNINNSHMISLNNSSITITRMQEANKHMIRTNITIRTISSSSIMTTTSSIINRIKTKTIMITVKTREGTNSLQRPHSQLTKPP